MALYTRPQLLVLLGVAIAFGGGLAINRWRHEHPELVARLERFDREDTAGAVGDGARDRTASAPAIRRAKDSGSPGPAPIDLNRATVGELTRLPGVGPALATRIIEAREAETFTSVEDLLRVRGVSASKLERLRPLITVAASP